MEARVTLGPGTRVACKGRDVHRPHHVLPGQQLAAVQGDLRDGQQEALSSLPGQPPPPEERSPSGMGPPSRLYQGTAPAPPTSWMAPSKPEGTAAARASLLKSGAPPT